MPKDTVKLFDMLVFYGVLNVTSAVKLAKYDQLAENKIVFKVLTDLMQLHSSRLQEMKQKFGKLLLHSAHLRWVHAN